MPLAVLSPAKTFNESVGEPPFACSEPVLCAERAELVQTVAKLSKAQLKSLMGISDALAELNAKRYAAFDAQPEMNAAVAFDGPAHRALGFATLGAAGQAYAQEHIVTLSGLYGCLRPRDAIKPYRLEMGTKLANARGGTLYAFWGDRIASELHARLRALPQPERFVVNVASQEYWQAVGPGLDALGVSVWHVEFPGPTVYAKQARGLFCRFMAETGVSSPAQLEGFAEWSARPESGAGDCHYRRAEARGGGGKSAIKKGQQQRLCFARVSGPAPPPGVADGEAAGGGGHGARASKKRKR